jgi:hypothetical protein
MIPSQAFPVAELSMAAVAVLAAIAIASKEECVGDLTAEAAGNVDELNETDDRRFWECQSFASDDVSRVRLDNLGFPLNDETERSPERDHCQWLEGGVQRQTPHGGSPMAICSGYTKPGG